jgi:uroporphyrinogen decarboxylase
MNKREQMNMVFQGAPLKRVPLGFWFHFLKDAETKDALKDPSMLFRSIAGHRAFIEGFQPDMVKVMSDGFFFYPSEGPINSLDELSHNVLELSGTHPFVTKQLELLRKVMEIDPHNNYFYNIFSPLTTLRFLLGYEKIIAFLKEDPRKLSLVLISVGKTLSALAYEVANISDGIYLSVQNPNKSIFSDEFYKEFISPSEQMVLDSASNGRNILHICGYSGVRNNVAFFSNYKAQAFNWAVNVESFPLSIGRKCFIGKVLIGGFQNTKDSILYKGTRDDIINFTKGIIKDAGASSLIIGADCTVPNDISLDRLSWVREAAEL